MTIRTANAPRSESGEKDPRCGGHAPAQKKRNRIWVAPHRVTDHEDQETSWLSRHIQICQRNPPELVAFMPTKSGTRHKRENFMGRIADCEAGKIDMVLSKSISRWANTLDSEYIRKLALESIFYQRKHQ